MDRKGLTLRCELQCLGTGETHHHTSISHGLQYQRDESRSRTSQSSGRVKVLFVQEPAPTTAREDGENEGAVHWDADGRDDSHAFADLPLASLFIFNPNPTLHGVFGIARTTVVLSGTHDVS